MNLNYPDTQRILDALDDLIDLSRISVSTENKDYKGNLYRSDYVTFEKKYGIGVEVLDGETRVDFFDDHTHFGPSYSQDEDSDYIEETAAFIRRLLSEPLVKVETYKGNKRIRYEWFFQKPDGRRDSVAGVWLSPPFSFHNPFAKKHLVHSCWRFHREMGLFVQITDDTASLHQYDWDILIHIRCIGNTYSYELERYYFDEEESCNYYWVPIRSGRLSLYDTKEKALVAAREEAQQYCGAEKHRTVFDT